MKNESMEEKLQAYLRDNNYELIDKLGDISPVQEIRAALLKKKDANRGKDFLFEFNENTMYYFFLTKSKNPNYLEPVKTSSSPSPSS